MGTTANDIHDELKLVLRSTHTDDFHPGRGEWYVGYGPASGYTHPRAPYWDTLDGAGSGFGLEAEAKVIRLSYRPAEESPSDWVNNTNYIAIRFGSDWEPKHNLDGDYGDVVPSRESRSHEDAEVVEKYMVGGPLVDPVVTGHPGSVLKEIRDQSLRVKAGADLNHIFEVLHGSAHHYVRLRDVDKYRTELPSPDDLPDDLFGDDVRRRPPIDSVEGIGSKTIQRFASRFAVYPNILTAADGDFDGLMPGWSHHPNLGRVDEIIAAVDEHYRAIMEDGWPDPEQFENYPSGNPIYDRPV